MNVEPPPQERRVPEDPIERKERKRGGMGPPRASMLEAELAPEAARHRPGEPLVKVAQQNPRPEEPGRSQDFPVKQTFHLLPPFGEGETEVNVEEVEDGPARFQVNPEPPAGLAPDPREIEGAVVPDREPGQDGVPVVARRPRADRSHDHLHPELAADPPRLRTEHLLEADDVRLGLPQHLDDPVEIHPPVQAAAPVDVVGHDRQETHRRPSWYALKWA